MEQKSKKIISITIIALIIIVGIVVVSKFGFNKELKFAQSQSIDIDVEQKVDKKLVKQIANETLGMHNMVRTLEIYEDVVTIRATRISEQQKNNIVNKIKENYEFEQTAEQTNIKTIPATRLMDMYEQYILPFVISGVLVVAYMMIRYYKKGALKVLAKIVIIPIVAESLFLSWIAIARIPMGRIIPVLVILVYIASVWYTMKKIEE